MEVITTQEAKQRMSDWSDFVMANTNLKFAFKKDKKPFNEFIIPFQEFKYLLNRIGTQFFNVRFGKELNFELIVWGVDKEGTATTDYFSIHEGGEAATSAISPLDQLIPDTIMKVWIQDWQDLVDKGNIPNALFKLQLSKDALLEGYTFKAKDFLNIFKNLSDDPDNLQVFFRFVNHKFGESVADGSFGLVLSVETTTKSSNGATFNFWDMAAPCPPTCIGGQEFLD